MCTRGGMSSYSQGVNNISIQRRVSFERRRSFFKTNSGMAIRDSIVVASKYGYRLAQKLAEYSYLWGNNNKPHELSRIAAASTLFASDYQVLVLLLLPKASRSPR